MAFASQQHQIQQQDQQVAAQDSQNMPEGGGNLGAEAASPPVSKGQGGTDGSQGGDDAELPEEVQTGGTPQAPPEEDTSPAT